MIALACAAALGAVPAVPVGPLRIVALGTSLTARGGWTGPLREALARRLGRPVALTVVARPGATSRWLIGAADDVAAAHPAVVLVEAAANDAALDRPVSLAESRANLRRIVTTVRGQARGVRVIVMAMNPAAGLRGWLRPRLDRFADAHLADAAALGAETVDFRPAWRALPAAARRSAIPDGLHPQPAAAARIMVAPLLARLAPSAEGRSAR